LIATTALVLTFPIFVEARIIFAIPLATEAAVQNAQ
jgi:hypothetical protein